MLSIFKKLLRKDEPSEAVALFGKAKNEREALLLLKEARRRDESRRETCNARLGTISNEEQILLSEGRQEETGTGRKMFLARRIKELREEARELTHKVDKIYNPRMRAYAQHIQSLETVIEVRSEPLPEMGDMETTAIKAKTMMSDLDLAVELASGISTPYLKETMADDEEKAILAEMEVPKKEKGKEKKPKESTKEAKKKTHVDDVDFEAELSEMEGAG